MKDVGELIVLYSAKFQPIDPLRSIPPRTFGKMLQNAIDRGSPLTQEEINAAIRERFLEDPTAVA